MYAHKFFFLFLTFFVSVFFSYATPAFGQAPRILTGQQGGTGIGSATVGDIGKCLVVSGALPFTYTLSSCGSGGGGGTGIGWVWNNINQLRNSTTTDQILLGNTSTSTNSKLEVFRTIGNLYAAVFHGNTQVDGTLTANNFVATSTTATSTFAGDVTVGTSILRTSGSGTSTLNLLTGTLATYNRFHWTGGTSTGLFGINLTGGCFAINGTCISGGGGSITGSGIANQLTYWTGTSAIGGTTTLNVASINATSSATVAQLIVGNLSGVLKAASGVVSGGATTSDVPEGTNLYYTTTRGAQLLAGTTTDAIAEGSNNLYYTTGRVRDLLQSVSGSLSVSTSSMDANGVVYFDGTNMVTDVANMSYSGGLFTISGLTLGSGGMLSYDSGNTRIIVGDSTKKISLDVGNVLELDNYQDGGTVPRFSDTSSLGKLSFASTIGTTTISWNSTASSSFAGGIVAASLKLGTLSGCAQFSNGYLQTTGSNCGSGGGGGSDVNWTFFNGSGIRPATSSNTVLIGGTATTSDARLHVVGSTTQTGAFIAGGEIRAPFFTGTSSATSSFAGDLTINNTILRASGSGTSTLNLLTGTLAVFNKISWTTGTSTGAFGINLTGGCYAINGTCLTTGGSSASSTLLSDNNHFSALNYLDGGFITRATSTIQSLNVTTITGSTGTTTFSNGAALDHFSARGMLASDSSGVHFNSHNGTQVALFGAGGGSNATFSGGLDVTGALQAYQTLAVTGSSTLGSLNTSSSTLGTFLAGNGTTSALSVSGQFTNTNTATATFSGGIIAGRIRLNDLINCDVKSSGDGTFYCGTDATGGGGTSYVATSTYAWTIFKQGNNVVVWDNDRGEAVSTQTTLNDAFSKHIINAATSSARKKLSVFITEGEYPVNATTTLTGGGRIIGNEWVIRGAGASTTIVLNANTAAINVIDQGKITLSDMSFAFSSAAPQSVGLFASSTAGTIQSSMRESTIERILFFSTTTGHTAPPILIRSGFRNMLSDLDFFQTGGCIAEENWYTNAQFISGDSTWMRGFCEVNMSGVSAYRIHGIRGLVNQNTIIDMDGIANHTNNIMWDFLAVSRTTVDQFNSEEFATTTSLRSVSSAVRSENNTFRTNKYINMAPVANGVVFYTDANSLNNAFIVREIEAENSTYLFMDRNTLSTERNNRFGEVGGNVTAIYDAGTASWLFATTTTSVVGSIFERDANNLDYLNRVRLWGDKVVFDFNSGADSFIYWLTGRLAFVFDGVEEMFLGASGLTVADTVTATRFAATSTVSASTLPYASTTAITTTATSTTGDILANAVNGLFAGLRLSITGSGTSTQLQGFNATQFALSGGTSTAVSGFNITGGCYAINGSCIGGTGGSGTVNSGTQGQTAWYAANGTAVSGTSSLIIDPTTGRIRINTTNTNAFLNVIATAAVQGMQVMTDAPSTIAFSSYVPGDSFTRFSFLGDGTLEFGAGSTIADLVVKRLGTGVLGITGKNTQAAALVVGTTSVNQNFEIYAAGALNGTLPNIACNVPWMSQTSISADQLGSATAAAGLCGGSYFFDINTDANILALTSEASWIASGTPVMQRMISGNAAPNNINELGMMKTTILASATTTSGKMMGLMAEHYIQLVDVGTATTSVNYIFGFSDVAVTSLTTSASYTSPKEGCYIVASSTESWRAVCRRNNAEAQNQVVVATSTAVTKFRYAIDQEGFRVWVNDSITPNATIGASSIPTSYLRHFIGTALSNGVAAGQGDMGVANIKLWYATH